MPIYEYKCTECEFQFERIQKFTDLPIKLCPQCSGDVEKLLSLSSFHLKGNGWYKTDYANSKETSNAKKIPGSKPEKDE